MTWGLLLSVAALAAAVDLLAFEPRGARAGQPRRAGDLRRRQRADAGRHGRDPAAAHRARAATHRSPGTGPMYSTTPPTATARQRGIRRADRRPRRHGRARPARGMTPHSPVDLHLHSTASDGMLDPAALVAHVAACGVRLMALTDHDTVAGVEAAATAAREHGIAFVAGVEISASWRGTDHPRAGACHRPRRSPRSRARCAAQQASARDARPCASPSDSMRPARREARRLRRSAPREACRRGRTSRARWSRSARLRDMGAAFERWLGRGRPGHVGERLAGARRGDCVDRRRRRQGGDRAPDALPALRRRAARACATEFAAAGGRGVEVMTGGGSPRDREAAISLAVRCRLEGSVGSDFHDPAVPWNPPGRLAKLPDSIRPVWSDFEPA